MKLSQTTLTVLSNFASINQNIYIEQGNVIKTKAPNSLSVIATAEIGEQFPRAFGIYELSKFLNTLNLFDEPDLEFHDGHMTIEKGKSKASYAYTQPDLVDGIKDYSKNITAPDPLLKFTLTEDVFKRIQKSAKLFDVQEINISSAEGHMVRITASGSAMNSANANKFTVDVDAPETWNEGVSVNIKLDTLKFLPGDYKCDISVLEKGDKKLGICKFKNETIQDATVSYIVAAAAE